MNLLQIRPSSKKLATFLFAISLSFSLLMVVAFIHGFPLPYFEKGILRAKSLRTFFEISLISLILGILFHPHRSEIFSALKQKAARWTHSPKSIWVLSGIYFLLFFWQQVTKYLALEMNFIPFLFYDYMLWFFDQGKFCYTGLLHGYYHANLILLALYPVWKIIPTQWILHVASPLIVAVSAVPFYAWARERLQNSLEALIAAFVFLNFRYIQNLLHVNFAVEVFYPLFIFAAVYFASKKKEGLYYLSVTLGLLVKEDSAIYFGALGAFFLFSPLNRVRGICTMLLSGAYLVFILKIFLPWSGSNILKGDLENYPGQGSGMMAIVGSVIRKPWLLIQQLFWPLEKAETLFKLNSKLLFLPWLSPWSLLVLVSIYPLFFQSTGDGSFFFKLAFYYGAAVIPFLFLAFVDGWSKIKKSTGIQRRPFIKWGIAGALIFLNGMNFRPLHFTADDLKSILLAKSLPQARIVVAQGHLLPYLGYRPWNFYISEQYEIRRDTREAYLNPDYYLFDFEANAYPLDAGHLRQKAEDLKKDPRWKVAHQDHRRLLLQRQREP